VQLTVPVYKLKHRREKATRIYTKTTSKNHDVWKPNNI